MSDQAPFPPPPPPPPPAPAPGPLPPQAGQPPSVGSAPAKKGLSILAWFAIGCAGLALLVGIAVAVGSYMVVRKVQEVAGDVLENPVLGMARIAIKLHPDLEEVSVDEEGGTITVRERNTGEVVTANIEDIEEGRIRFSSGDKELVLEVAGEDGDGSLRITGDDGSFEISGGEHGGENVPQWVPRYPGAISSGAGLTIRHSEEGDGGGFEAETGDSIQTVIEFYKQYIEDHGYKTDVTTMVSEDDATQGALVAHNEDLGRTLHVMCHEEDGVTKMIISYSQRI